jgi:hypothetical protein
MASLFLRRGRQVKSYYPVSRREDVPETGFQQTSPRLFNTGQLMDCRA